MIRILIFVVVTLLVLQFPSVAQVICYPNERGLNFAPNNYDRNLIDVTEEKTVRINFHFFAKSGGTGNFTPTGNGLGGDFSIYDLSKEIVDVYNETVK